MSVKFNYYLHFYTCVCSQAGLGCNRPLLLGLAFLCVYTAPWGRPTMTVALCIFSVFAILVKQIFFLSYFDRSSERARHAYSFFSSGVASHLGPLSAFTSKLGRPETTLAFTSKLGWPQAGQRLPPELVRMRARYFGTAFGISCVYIKT